MNSAFEYLNSTPGPGTYLKEHTLEKKVGITMASRYKEKPLNEYPGPGSYKQKNTLPPK